MARRSRGFILHELIRLHKTGIVELHAGHQARITSAGDHYASAQHIRFASVKEKATSSSAAHENPGDG